MVINIRRRKAETRWKGKCVFPSSCVNMICNRAHRMFYFSIYLRTSVLYHGQTCSCIFYNIRTKHVPGAWQAFSFIHFILLQQSADIGSNNSQWAGHKGYKALTGHLNEIGTNRKYRGPYWLLSNEWRHCRRFVYIRWAFFVRIKCLWFSRNAFIFKFHYTGEGALPPPPLLSRLK